MSARGDEPCACAECARLDFEHPGEGKQLALPIVRPRRRRTRKHPAEAHA